MAAVSGADTVTGRDGTASGTATLNITPQTFSGPFTGATIFATGYDVCDDATGGTIQTIGPIGLAFDSSNFSTPLTSAPARADRLPLTGGDVTHSAAHNNGLSVGLAIASGHYYGIARCIAGVTRGLYEFNPSTLAVVRTLTTAFSPRDVVTDPITGDLYVSGCEPGGLFRVQNAATTPAITSFGAGTSSLCLDGLGFSSDGSVLYAADLLNRTVHGYDMATGNEVLNVSVPDIPDGIAVAPAGTTVGGVNVSGNVFVNTTHGKIDRIDTNNNNQLSSVVSAGSRGDFVVVGPDGCLYAAQGNYVEKLAPCFFKKTLGPLDHITISPASSTITIGSSQTYQAEGFDAFNNDLGDVTASTPFSLSPDGSCVGAICTPASIGTHTVTANDNGRTATATLNVVDVLRGTLTIAKTLTNNDGATVPASYAMTYNCSDGTTGTVPVTAGHSASVGGIATGSTCSVTETAPASITGYTWTPASYSAPSVVIANTTGTFTITVTNTITRDRGTLTIAKTLTNNDGATVPASYAMTYNCSDGTTGTVPVTAGHSASVGGIATGSTCSVTETAPASITGYTWTPASYSAPSVVIANTTGTFTITVTNTITRDRGTLTIAKTLTNNDGATVPASYAMTYNCSDGTTGTVPVTAGHSASVGGIATGSTCSVTETAPASITGYTWTPASYSAPSVVIANTTGTFTITVTNTITRDRGTLTIAKTLTNNDGATVPASYAMTYNCSDGTTAHGARHRRSLRQRRWHRRPARPARSPKPHPPRSPGTPGRPPPTPPHPS